MKRVLTIAASDSGGGAGIQADIKAITVLGGFAMSAVTAITVQNTLGVKGIHPVPASFVTDQIDAVLEDIGADAAKTGMLLSAEIIQKVAEALGRHGVKPVVVDPVMISTSGDFLMEPAAVSALTKYLLPLAAVVSPNLDEAAALAGMPVDSLDSMKAAARRIFEQGPGAVLIKGGHLKGDCVDVLYDGRSFTTLAAARIQTRSTHGTGCTYSAAIAAHLAAGATVPEAVSSAKEFITRSIRFSRPLGKGHGPTNPMATLPRSAQVYDCAEALKQAFSRLAGARIGHLIPEIQSNLGYAIEAAETPDDVVAFPGRIIRLGDSIARVAEPAPGASRHIAKIILTALRHDRRCRSAMNIAWTPGIVERCRAAGLEVAEFSRKEEPPDVKEQEGASLEWGTQKAISRTGRVPDIIFDRGDVGKEPVSRVLGTDPLDVIKKILKIEDKR